MPEVSSTPSDPTSRRSNPAGPRAATCALAARRRSDFAEADDRCAARSPAQASTARPAITSASAPRGPRRDARPRWSTKAPATTVASSHACAIRSSAVAPPTTTARIRKRRVERVVLQEAWIERTGAPAPCRAGGVVLGRLRRCVHWSPSLVRHRHHRTERLRRRRSRASGTARAVSRRSRRRTTYARGGVMSTAAARTYTTTVGSQTVELPLVPLNDELTIALLICVDLGVAFAETAGRELAELMRPARPEIVVSVATMGIPIGHRGEPRPGIGRLRHPAQDAQDPPRRVLVRAGVLDHDRQAPAPPRGPGPGGRRAWQARGGGRRRRLHRRLAVVGPSAGPPHGRRTRGRGDADDRGRRTGGRRWARTRLWSAASAPCRCSIPTGPAASSRTGTEGFAHSTRYLTPPICASFRVIRSQVYVRTPGVLVCAVFGVAEEVPAPA